MKNQCNYLFNYNLIIEDQFSTLRSVITFLKLKFKSLANTKKKKTVTDFSGTNTCNIVKCIYIPIQESLYIISFNFMRTARRCTPAHFMVRHKLSTTHKVESPTGIQLSMYPRASVTWNQPIRFRQLLVYNTLHSTMQTVSDIGSDLDSACDSAICEVAYQVYLT